MCIAEHLGRVHGASYARLATEIPLATPNRVAIGSHGREGSWAQRGRPRSTPSSLFKPDGSVHRGEIVDHLQGMKVQFRAHDIKPYTDTSWLDFSAYLVFTGEPHLVIFPQWHFADLAEVIFNGPATDWGGHRSSERRSGFGDWLVERIGASINDRYRHLFPGGVNVNFVRLLGADLIEYRCYERGINRETLACGTGALAVAFVSGHLGKVEADDLQILPHLCRRFDGEASIKVYLSDQGGRIESSPRFLFDGLYRFPAPIHRQVIHRQDKSAMPALTQSDEFATNPYLAVAR
ncbi:MAG: diaminopimelate epimerase, partial [Candidatus Competibacteraceae bacterium]|nr:diaminopimelate epimerase [Candidatus Competibacteraceae bacterium]